MSGQPKALTVTETAWAELIADERYSTLLHADVPLRAAAVLVRGQGIERGPITYLATPYSLEAQWQGRFNAALSDAMAAQAARWSAHCALNGVTAISPIVLSVAMVNDDVGHQIDPLDAGFWSAWCRPLLEACGSVIVPPIKGWSRSMGVWHEVNAALRRRIPVYLVSSLDGRDEG